MKLGAALLLVILVAPCALASHPLTLVLQDWTDVDFVAGAPVALSGPDVILNSKSVPLAVPACHRLVLLDVFFSPNATRLGLDGLGEATLVHELRASLLQEGSEVGAVRITREGYGFGVALAPAEGEFSLQLQEVVGRGMHVSFRVRGELIQDDPACVDPA